MYVLVKHTISHPSEFYAAAAEGNAHLPPGLTLHHVFSAPDGRNAVCLWEAESAEAVRDFVEPATRAFARNEYIPVMNREGIAVPAVLQATA